MQVTAFTPKGRVVLDLDVAKDIETFGGQEAVAEFMEMQKNPLEAKVAKLEAEVAALKAAKE